MRYLFLVILIPCACLIAMSFWLFMYGAPYWWAPLIIVAILLWPAKWDPAIRIKEWQIKQGWHPESVQCECGHYGCIFHGQRYPEDHRTAILEDRFPRRGLHIP